MEETKIQESWLDAELNLQGKSPSCHYANAFTTYADLDGNPLVFVHRPSLETQLAIEEYTCKRSELNNLPSGSSEIKSAKRLKTKAYERYVLSDLKDFGFSYAGILDHVPDCAKPHDMHPYKAPARDRAIYKIQSAWRNAWYNPQYKMCRDRLMREFQEL